MKLVQMLVALFLVALFQVESSESDCVPNKIVKTYPVQNQNPYYIEISQCGYENAFRGKSGSAFSDCDLKTIQYGPFNACTLDPNGRMEYNGSYIPYNSSVTAYSSINETVLFQESLFVDSSCAIPLFENDPYDPLSSEGAGFSTEWGSSCVDGQPLLRKIPSIEAACPDLDSSSGVVTLNYHARPSCSLESLIMSYCFKVDGCVPTAIVHVINENLPPSCGSSAFAARLTEESPGSGATPTQAPTASNVCNFMAFDSTGGKRSLLLSLRHVFDVHALAHLRCA